MTDAASQFAERLRGLAAVQAEVSVVVRPRDQGRLGYFLEPEAAEPLLRFHAQVHARVNWGFEPFREIDLPGTWRPHLTLFSIPAARETQARPALEELGRISVVSLERIGMVSFLEGTHVMGEAKLGGKVQE